MPLIRVADPFDDPDWIFELKHDGFRALAHVEANRCELVSRRGHVYKQFAKLQAAIGQTVRARRAILDGEVVCLAPDGRSQFYDLVFHRGRPHVTPGQLVVYGTASCGLARVREPAGMSIVDDASHSVGTGLV
jgi:ATP-dependent DNA ligase